MPKLPVIYERIRKVDQTTLYSLLQEKCFYFAQHSVNVHCIKVTIVMDGGGPVTPFKSGPGSATQKQIHCDFEKFGQVSNKVLVYSYNTAFIISNWATRSHAAT